MARILVVDDSAFVRAVIVESLRLGAKNFAVKPVHPARLLHAINTALS